MSGAASLAAAKRRRGGSQNSSQTVNGRNTTSVEPLENEGLQHRYTPMSILTQHHIRLNNIEDTQEQMSSMLNSTMGSSSEINDFDDRLTQLETQIVEKRNISEKVKKLELQIKEMNKLLLKVQSTAMEASNSALKNTKISIVENIDNSSPTFGNEGGDNSSE
jgi:hypothetical protein